MKIDIQTIPHSEQRYDTVGDWWFDTPEETPMREMSALHIRVSDMHDRIYEWLVAEHEINEALMCQKSGIAEKQVSGFDVRFESLRSAYPDVIGDQEPGDMVSAPYHKQHVAATEIETLSAKHHEVDWRDYEESVNKL